MAHLVRVKIVRHTDPKTGKRVPAKTPGAVAKSLNSRKWYGQGIPGQSPTKRVPLATDKSVAQRMLDSLVRSAERGEYGMPDADAGKLPLGTLLSEFERDLSLGLASKARGSKRRTPSAEQVSLTVQRIRDVIGGCKFTVVGSLNASAPAKLAKYLTDRTALPRDAGGFSVQSAEFYRAAAKRFAWWLSARRKCPVRVDLFDDVPAGNPRENRVHSRRRIGAGELPSLLAVTRASLRPYRGLAGEDRYSLYLLALTSGFRANEIARLERTSFLLDDLDAPIVQLRAKTNTKTRGARQPIPLGVAEHFRAYLPTRPAKGPVWPGTWSERPAQMLKKDLRAAGIDYAVDAGDGERFLDFHALRHSYISALAEAGVGPKELQVLARHADPGITLGIYTHASAGSLSGAVERLALPAGKGGGGATGAGTTLAGMSREELEGTIIALACVVRTLSGG